jgi:hypothetical protein
MIDHDADFPRQTLRRVLSYEEVIDLHDLTLLKKGVDLVVEGGSIAISRSGDLRLGSTAQHGLWRLVQHWRFNAPTLETLFDAVYHLKHELKDIEENELPRRRIQTMNKFEDSADRVEARTMFNLAHDARGGASFGLQTYAGCVLVSVGGLLSNFRDDIEISERDPVWISTGPVFAEFSYGQILVAAGNAFRHYDEWIKNPDSKDKRQVRSTSILARALRLKLKSNFDLHDACTQVLQLLSDGKFKYLEKNLFLFAHSLANHAEQQRNGYSKQ